MKNEVTILKTEKLLGLFVVTYRLEGENFNRVSNRRTMEEVNKAIQELIQEWPNLQAVMEWCQLQDRYEPVKTLWENLRSFTLLVGRHVTRLGYWDDRLAWTAWLTQAAEHRADGPTAMQSRLDHAWTLIALGKPDQLAEAENILLKKD